MEHNNRLRKLDKYLLNASGRIINNRLARRIVRQASLNPVRWYRGGDLDLN